MDMTNAKDAMKELTLALMYLSRFSDEDRFVETDNMAWKGYAFKIINELVDEDYIRDGSHPSRTKSVWITPDGVEMSKKILEKYHISDWQEK